jgi:hypothetical protein
LRKLKTIETVYEVKCIADYDEIGNPVIDTPEIAEACVKTTKEFYGENNVEILDKPSRLGKTFRSICM